MLAVSGKAARRAAVTALHASPTKLCVATTGGGGRFAAWLVAEPGCSGTLLSATVPYARGALAALIGTSDTSCSSATACRMAEAAFAQAEELRDLELPPPAPAPRRPDPEAQKGQGLRVGGRTPGLVPPPLSPVIGLGLTAALASNSAVPKRGEHRVHVALRTERELRMWELRLAKGERTRDEEDLVASGVVLHAAAVGAGLDAEQHAALALDGMLLDGEQVQEMRSQPGQGHHDGTDSTSAQGQARAASDREEPMVVHEADLTGAGGSRGRQAGPFASFRNNN